MTVDLECTIKKDLCCTKIAALAARLIVLARHGTVNYGEYQRWKQKEEKEPPFPEATQAVGKLKYTDVRWSYLRYPGFPAGLQEVLHIPPTLGHAELGLEESRTDTMSKTEGWERLSSSAQTEGEIPRQARERGCRRLNGGGRDWPGGRAQPHPSETDPGPQGGSASVGSRCSGENVIKVTAEVTQIINSSHQTPSLQAQTHKNSLNCEATVCLDDSEDEAWHKRRQFCRDRVPVQPRDPAPEPCALTWCDRGNTGWRTCRSCSMSSSSSRSCSILLLMVNWGSADSTLLWPPRNADTSTTTQGQHHHSNVTWALRNAESKFHLSLPLSMCLLIYLMLTDAISSRSLTGPLPQSKQWTADGLRATAWRSVHLL